MKRGFPFTACKVMLALVMTVSVEAVTLDETIAQQVLAQNHLDANYYEIQVISNRLKTTDMGDLTATVRPIGTKEPLGLYTVYVAVERQDSVVESGQVNLKIRKFADVLVARGPVGRHELVSPENAELQRREISAVYDQPIVSWQELSGRRLSRALGKGQIITAGALEPIPDIEVGREVAIVCTDGAITVTASGQALQKGRAGEYVRVKNRTSGKIVVAKVIDQTTVTVMP
ncbi:MAG: flagellar basal body P-ring formation chaperone FlgA [Candidatus Zixiibacteriota bacterium]